MLWSVCGVFQQMWALVFLPWVHFGLLPCFPNFLLWVVESEVTSYFDCLHEANSCQFRLTTYACSSTLAFANSVFSLSSFLRWRNFSSSSSISWSIFNVAASASGTAFLAAALALALTEEVCDDRDVLDRCDECDTREQQLTFDTLSFDWTHCSCSFNTS